MKKLLLIGTLILSFGTLAGPGHGHSHDHDHGHGHSHATAISVEKTKEVGRESVERLIEAKKIDASWKNSTYEKTEKKIFGNKPEWVVTFLNEKGVKGKKLYVFLSESGEFIAANFSGK